MDYKNIIYKIPKDFRMQAKELMNQKLSKDRTPENAAKRLILDEVVFFGLTVPQLQYQNRKLRIYDLNVELGGKNFKTKEIDKDHILVYKYDWDNNITIEESFPLEALHNELVKEAINYLATSGSINLVELTKTNPPVKSNSTDIKSAIAGAEVLLKYSVEKDKKQLKEYIKGLKTLLKLENVV